MVRGDFFTTEALRTQSFTEFIRYSQDIISPLCDACVKEKGGAKDCV